MALTSENIAAIDGVNSLAIAIASRASALRSLTEKAKAVAQGSGPNNLFAWPGTFTELKQAFNAPYTAAKNALDDAIGDLETAITEL